MNDKRPSIFLLDDDVDLVTALAARCEAAGLEAHTAHNTLTAMNKLSSLTPDMLCLDVEMPTGNGLTVGEFLISDSMLAGVPVIILTGRKDVETIQRCAELGARYIHKSPDCWPKLKQAIFERLSAEAGV